jgi:uncharacterized repeat protein (TIGR03803 family)
VKSIRLWTAVSVAAACVVGMLAVQSTQAQTYKVLRSFGGPKGQFPNGAGVIRDTEGNLYGTTYRGGTSNQGVVFKLSPTGKETVLYNFTGDADGGEPLGGVIRDANGNLYGTTSRGGNLKCPFGNGPGCGTVFKLDPTGKETVLYIFEARTGSVPIAGVIQDAQGNLYGTTSQGGAHGAGVVFKLSTIGKETPLHSFAGGTDGSEPRAGLIRDAEGNLYGTTFMGGDPACSSGLGCGTVFKLSRTGKESVLYSFTAGADGGYPEAGVIRDADGNLYGTTADRGGANDDGVVFKLDPTGKETVLHIFTGGTDGAGPAGVIQDAAGNLYGITETGGGDGNNGNGCGIAFKLDPTGTETILHVFAGQPDGCFAFAPLIQDAKGNLYGTTEGGGVDNFGTVFKLTP